MTDDDTLANQYFNAAPKGSRKLDYTGPFRCICGTTYEVTLDFAGEVARLSRCPSCGRFYHRDWCKKEKSNASESR